MKNEAGAGWTRGTHSGRNTHEPWEEDWSLINGFARQKQQPHTDTSMKRASLAWLEDPEQQ